MLTFRMLLLLAPAAIHLIQPINTVVESWYHYGFHFGIQREIGIGPVKTRIDWTFMYVKSAREAIAEATGIELYSPLADASLEAIVDYEPSFGQSFGPDTGNMRDYGPHGGVDLDARVGGGQGADVVSPATGKVAVVKDLCGDGSSYQIQIEANDGYGTVIHRLNHIDKIAVQEGQTVKAGERVASIAPTDCHSTGPHLDWKIDNGKEWVNPQTYVAQYLEKKKESTPPLASPVKDAGFLTDEQIIRSVGSAEGTLTPEGDRTSAFSGHVDPGNGVWNLGTFSYQHGADSPEEADAKQLARLRRQANELIQKARDKGVELDFSEAINGIDLANQAPLAALDKGGYVDRLVEAKVKGLKDWEAIHWARVWSFIDPDTGTWNAPGLGNNQASIEADQLRRMKAIEAAIASMEQPR